MNVYHDSELGPVAVFTSKLHAFWASVWSLGTGRNAFASHARRADFAVRAALEALREKERAAAEARAAMVAS